MSDLVEWVSDQLHDILGLSDTITSEFLVALAKKSSSGDTFLQKLKDTKALKINDRVSSFGMELWQKVPHQKAVNPYQASREKERAAIAQQQKNKTYQLLSDDDDEALAEKRAKKSAKTKGVKEKGGAKERRARKRGNIRKGKVESESSEEEKKPTSKKSKADSDSDEWEK